MKPLLCLPAIQLPSEAGPGRDPAGRPPKSGQTQEETYLAGADLERFDLLVARALAMQGVIAGAAFKFMRKALMLRAAELGDLLGVRPETISRWETE